MTLFVTTSPNDLDLAKALGDTVIRCPIKTDVAFWGRGDDDTTIKVGVERKKIGDLAQCIGDGRYLQQVQTAKDDGIDVLCLVVEGRIHCNPDDGMLEVPIWGINPRTLKRAEIYQAVRPNITYSRFDQFLTELQFLAGIIVKRSENVHETATIIKALYQNFQTAPNEHGSLRRIYEAPNRDSILLTRPGLVRRIAKELPNIGWSKSRAVAEHFKTVRGMANASEQEWMEIDGIGKGIAGKVVREINGGTEL